MFENIFGQILLVQTIYIDAHGLTIQGEGPWGFCQILGGRVYRACENFSGLVHLFVFYCIFINIFFAHLMTQFVLFCFAKKHNCMDLTEKPVVGFSHFLLEEVKESRWDKPFQNNWKQSKEFPKEEFFLLSYS